MGAWDISLWSGDPSEKYVELQSYQDFEHSNFWWHQPISLIVHWYLMGDLNVFYMSWKAGNSRQLPRGLSTMTTILSLLNKFPLLFFHYHYSIYNGGHSSFISMINLLWTCRQTVIGSFFRLNTSSGPVNSKIEQWTLQDKKIDLSNVTARILDLLLFFSYKIECFRQDNYALKNTLCYLLLQK